MEEKYFLSTERLPRNNELKNEKQERDIFVFRLCNKLLFISKHHLLKEKRGRSTSEGIS